MTRTLALAGAAALMIGAPLALAQPPAPPAQDFVARAGASDKFEITEAELAETRSHDPHIRRFAAKMIHDHTQSTMKVKAAARKVMGHNPPPPVLMPEQERMVADLRNARGPDFDRTYLEQQVQAHQQALELMSGYARSGDAPPLRHVAEEITPVVQQHLDMVKGMQSAHG